MIEKANKPLVSVAIITFNQKEFLRECIESCLAQDYPSMEIVVADDCSKDGTQELLIDYQSKYPGKFVLRLSQENKGITFNSNEALFACSGDYIAFMGGDDLMLENKITKQVDYMEANPNCTICYHNLDVFDSYTNKTLYYFNHNFVHEGDFTASIRYGTFNGACSTMIRRIKMPKTGFNSLLPVASDWYFWIETLANGGSIDYLDEVLGRYRRHSSNVTKSDTTITQNELDHLITCQLVIKNFPQHLADALFIYASHIYNLRFKSDYLKCSLTALLLRPRVKTFLKISLFIFSLGKIRK